MFDWYNSFVGYKFTINENAYQAEIVLNLTVQNVNSKNAQ